MDHTLKSTIIAARAAVIFGTKAQQVLNAKFLKTYAPTQLKKAIKEHNELFPKSPISF